MQSRLAFTAATTIFAGACALSENGLQAGEDAAIDSSVVDVAAKDVTLADVAAPDVVAPEEASTFDAPPDSPQITAGYALQFSGSAYVDMGMVPIPNDFTIEAWVNPTSTSGETYIVAEEERNQGDGQFRLGITSGALFFLMSDATGATHGLYNGGYMLVSPGTLKLDAWTHVAVIKSGASFALTINGASVATFTADASFSYGASHYAFRIAARVDTNGTAPNGNFAGTIDEVRVFSQALTPNQIASTMSTTISPTTTGLARYWRFDEGSGSNTADQVGNGYPGTLVASPAWVVSTAF